MKNIYMDQPVELTELLKDYGKTMESFINIKIGYDEKIYILLNDGISEAISGMPVGAGISYSAIVLTVDWCKGKIVNQEIIDLGDHKMNFRFIQPIGNNILLLGARCKNRSSNGPENNAVVIDRKGNIVNEFCFGDAILDCIVTKTGQIITSYFDEGIFGNYEWEHPIGSSGLIVWNKQGEIQWESPRSIFDCYAINLDEQDNLWYYYYDEFNLVKTDFDKEWMYKPDIKGADRFLITSDTRTVLFYNGFYGHNKLQSAVLDCDNMKEHEDISIIYNGEKLSVEKLWSL